MDTTASTTINYRREYEAANAPTESVTYYRHAGDRLGFIEVRVKGEAHDAYNVDDSNAAEFVQRLERSGYPAAIRWMVEEVTLGTVTQGGR